MNIIEPRKDFIIIEDFFTPEQAAEWLSHIFKLGKDPVRGFQRPKLRANRFHKEPNYPVEHYMCLGLYWNPVDYMYYPNIPTTDVPTFPITKEYHDFCSKVLHNYINYRGFSVESALVNYYTASSRLGVHTDKEEMNLNAPVIGLSFGSSCRFYFEDEHSKMQDILLKGNSIYVFHGTARMMKHGVGTLYNQTLSLGSETTLKNKERLSITFRQVY